jgi:arabinofuranan 3-O-arabinosyltransferase
MFKIHRKIPTPRTHWRPYLLAALSYLPLVALQRGRINADTKLYLGEDPFGLISRSFFAWDSSQFGGFVPHQAIAYLWPSGPFYWVFDLLGSPQWFTQRMWVGTIFFASAMGIYVLLQRLTFSPHAAFIAAFFFMSSPYVLAYQSRTSSMLLPWAATAWLCYFTSRGLSSRSWLWPSLIALTMFTVGSVNATATLLILPAPFLIAVLQSTQLPSMASFVGFATKTIFLTTGVSLWWIAMLYIQATYGAQLLSYSETLESVAASTHSFEVLRGFGYWLNYMDLDSLPLTTGAYHVFTSTFAMTSGVVLVVLAIGSLALSSHTQRRLGMWLVLSGTILSVSVYPMDDPSPLFSRLANNPTSTLSLAFRSSTRAMPILLLGLAIGIGILCDSRMYSSASNRISNIFSSLRISRTPLRVVGPLCVVALIALANPTRYSSGSFDPTLERTPIPNSWRNFFDDVEATPTTDSRIVQLPGQEFGAYTWGYTVDPALPAVTDTQLLTRDLIPLGSESMMNLLWATDEAFREGRLHPNALQSMARVLSTRTFFFPGDLDNDRYGTPSQQEALQANSLLDATQTVESTPNTHRFITYASTDTSLMRQTSSTMLLLGDGKGIVDTAVAGLLKNETIIYAGHLNNEDLAAEISRSSHVVVTDTHTEKAQHWRSSQDTLGFDENREGDTANLGRDSGDIRMRIFPTTRSDDMTWFEQVGPLRIRASSYGPPFSFRPEHRPFAAIDNNLQTSWTVAHGVTPLAPVIQLLSQDFIDTIRLTQPQHDINRRITDISVSVDEQPWVNYSLSEASLDQGDLVVLPTPGNVITIRIDATTPTRPLRVNEELSGVGFAEITTNTSATQEVGVLPSRGLENLSSNTPLSYVLTRRVAPIARENRSDIEYNYVRSLFVPNTQQMNVNVRFDISDFSPNEIEKLQRELTTRSPLRINGIALNVASISITNDASLIGIINQVPFDSGNHLVESTSDLYPIDQIVISNNTQHSSTEVLAPRITSSELVHKTIELQPCPTGCWFVFGEGHNTGWKATLGGVDIGASVVVDGGAHGWWIEPSTTTQTLTLTFTPQRTLNIALALSALFVLASVIVAVTTRRTLRTKSSVNVSSPQVTPVWNMAAVLVVHLFTMLALFDVRTAMWTTAVIAVALWTHTHKILTWIVAGVFTIAMGTTWWESLTTTLPLDFGWPRSTQASHHTLLACLVILAVLCLVRPNSATHKEQSHPLA